jgi:hypothetical protein
MRAVPGKVIGPLQPMSLSRWHTASFSSPQSGNTANFSSGSEFLLSHQKKELPNKI